MTVSNSTATGGIISGNAIVFYSENATVTTNDNSVLVFDSKITGDIIGGNAHAETEGNETTFATANSNSVSLSTSEITGDIYGGYAYAFNSENATAAANSNSVTVSSESTVSAGSDSRIIAGFSYAYTESEEASATANDNSVIVSETKVQVDIMGGQAYAYTESGNSTPASGNISTVAMNNCVTVSDNAEVTGNIYAGYAYADAYSGRNATGASTASSNTVTLLGSKVTGNINGGYAYSRNIEAATVTANANTVTVSNSEVTGGINGGNAYAKTNYSGTLAVSANTNKVTVSGSEVAGDIMSGKAYSQIYDSENVKATANSNTVTVSETSKITGNIYGGYGEAINNKNTTATVNSSTVAVSNSEVTGNIHGSYTYAHTVSGIASATSISNSVAISDGATVKTSEIYGASVLSSVKNSGNGSATSNASENLVTISDANVQSSKVYGAFTSATALNDGIATSAASKNVIAIENTTLVNSEIYGGKALAFAGFILVDEDTSLTAVPQELVAKATENTVIVSGSETKVTGNIYGGFVEVSGTSSDISTESATKNTITISDATIESSMIVGGAVTVESTNKTHTATGNTVTLAGAYRLNAVSLYGGYNVSSNALGTNDDLFTGNTLNLDARKVSSTTVSNVANFETINIQAGNVSNGDTVLATTSTTLGNGTTGTTVKLLRVESSSLKAGDTLTLISNVTGTLANDEETLSLSDGESFAISSYDAKISLTNGNVIATVLSATFNPETKVLNEARVASQAFINGATDLLLNTTIQGGSFGEIRGGHSRYKTGSSADIDGVNLVAGFSHSIAGKNGDTTGGLFFEAGWGETTTRNTIGGKSLKGSGNTHYYGAGLLVRYDLTNGAASGLYADASLRAGRLSNDYHNNDATNVSGERVSFDIGSTYYAAHVGVGYKWDLTNSLRLDTSAQYMFSHVDSKDIAILGDAYHFDSMNSHRTRLGVKLDYTADKLCTPYMGLAWEHEFSGKAKASVRGKAMDSADLGGSTGIVSLGVDFKPEEKSAFLFNAGFVGEFGVRQGIAGQLMMHYKF